MLERPNTTTRMHTTNNDCHQSKPIRTNINDFIILNVTRWRYWILICVFYLSAECRTQQCCNSCQLNINMEIILIYYTQWPHWPFSIALEAYSESTREWEDERMREWALCSRYRICMQIAEHRICHYMVKWWCMNVGRWSVKIGNWLRWWM